MSVGLRCHDKSQWVTSAPRSKLTVRIDYDLPDKYLIAPNSIRQSIQEPFIMI